jgi:hypothetical protein
LNCVSIADSRIPVDGRNHALEGRLPWQASAFDPVLHGLDGREEVDERRLELVGINFLFVILGQFAVEEGYGARPGSEEGIVAGDF